MGRIIKSSKFDFWYSASFFPLTLLLLAFIMFNRGQGLSTNYLIIYVGLGVVAGLYFLGNMILEFTPKYKNNPISGYGFVSDSNSESFLRMWGVFRFVPHILFAIIIVLSAFAGQEIIPPPIAAPFAEEVVLSGTISPLKLAFFNSVPVGIFEDVGTLIITVVSMLILYFPGRWIFGESKKISFAVRGVIGSIIGATFFTLAHTSAYQQDAGAYIIAWIFAFVNMLITVFTGLFFPIAHIANNFFWSLGFFAGGAAIYSFSKFMFIPVIKKNMWRLKEKC